MKFLSFYSEGEPYDNGYNLTNTVDEIKNKLSKYFDEMIFYNKRTLKQLPNSDDICNSFDEPLVNNPNANHFGYFDFKGFIIDNQLEKMEENELLIYHDSNFIRNQQYWQTDWDNLEKICYELLRVNNTDVFFQFEYEGSKVKQYVKEYTLDYFFTQEEKQIVKECYLINAARMIIINTEFSRNFIKEYLGYCKNKTLISKNPNNNPDVEFQASCGDQDVLNCMVYRYILDGKFPITFPIFSFLYRIIRIENKPFMWEEYKRFHYTGISELYNQKLIEYIKNKGAT